MMMGSYPTLFTLTSHYMTGGIVSVALSLGLPPVAVSNYHIPNAARTFLPAPEKALEKANSLL